MATLSSVFARTAIAPEDTPDCTDGITKQSNDDTNDTDDNDDNDATCASSSSSLQTTIASDSCDFEVNLVTLFKTTKCSLRDEDIDSNDRAPKEGYKRSNSLDHVYPELTDLRRSNSAGNIRSQLPDCPLRKLPRQFSSPVLTNQQKEKVIKHRSILLVKTQSEALLSTNDDSYSLFRAARRRRRKVVIAGGVAFGTCEIREYPMTLGDNPGGNWGPPLTISWDFQSTVILAVDEFETEHPSRRTSSQMIIPIKLREDILMKAGFTRGEIQAGLKQVNLNRNRRKRTIELLHLTTLQEMAEKAARTASNILFRRKKKTSERMYLKQAMEVHRSKASEMERDLSLQH